MTNIDVFYYRLGNHLLDTLVAGEALKLLDGSENERLAKIKNQHAKQQFLITRYLAKTEIGRILNCKVEGVAFRYSTNKKPFLQNSGSLYFSLSHCPKACMCALASDNVGVDIEQIERCEKLVGKATDFFPAMVGHFEGPGKNFAATEFTTFWTCLEAQVKFKDAAIFTERNSFELMPIGDKLYQNKQPLNLWAYRLPGNIVMSLACSHQQTHVSLWTVHEESCAEVFELTKKLNWQKLVGLDTKLLLTAVGG